MEPMPHHDDANLVRAAVLAGTMLIAVRERHVGI
jgi:hypothetical protein